MFRIKRRVKLDSTRSVQTITVANNHSVYVAQGFDLYCWPLKDDKPKKVAKLSTESITDMVWDGKDTIYMCSAHLSSIHKYEISTNTCTKFASYPDARGFGSFEGITIDTAGNLYVARDFQILKINVETTSIEKFYESKYRISHIRMIPDGTIYARINGEVYQIKDNTETAITDAKLCPSSISAYEDGLLVITQMESEFKKTITSIWSKLVPTLTESVQKITLKPHLKISPVKETIDQHPRCAVMVKNKIIVGSVGQLMVLEHTWNEARYLWIGHLKEGPSHPLANIPRDMLRLISSFL